MFGCENSKPIEIFLIPRKLDNFVVIYNANINIDYKTDVVYRIPRNGILQVEFQRNKGVLNHKFYIVDREQKEKIELRSFAFDDYRNNIDVNKQYQLDNVDGSFINKKFANVIGDKITMSTDNPNAKEWFGIIIGKPNANQNKLRGKLFSKVDSLRNE